MNDKKLIDYLPLFLQDIREYSGLMNAVQPEVDSLRAALAQLLADVFVDSASSSGLSRWEKSVGITHASAGAAKRRKDILTKLNGLTLHSVAALREELAGWLRRESFDDDIEVDAGMNRVLLYTDMFNIFLAIQAGFNIYFILPLNMSVYIIQPPSTELSNLIPYTDLEALLSHSQRCGDFYSGGDSL